MTGDPLLRVRDLRKHFPGRRSGLARRGAPVRAVDGISFDVAHGETLALVGESGSGKSTTGRLVTRLLAPTGGTVELAGRDVTTLSARRMRPLRRDVQMVFQDPYSSLNPRHTVGSVVGAGLRIHGLARGAAVRTEVQALLERVGLDPSDHDRYPHELSGGQRQRVAVARALAVRPRLVVCDEPVSALDVSVQAQVLNLLQDLQAELGLSYLFVAHDLSVVRHVADRVAVMYLGRLMEVADRETIYRRPRHPYTHALLAAAPVAHPGARRDRTDVVLGGDPPDPTDPPSGCVFRTRCPRAQQRCADEVPTLRALPDAGPAEGAAGESQVACHFPL